MAKDGKNYKTPKEAEAESEAAHRARAAYLAQGVHGSGKATLKVPGDKRTPGQRLYQIG